jgi:diguanylate cyclase (GGDEF)-like protein/PAS domain S-box-containing protein
MNSLYEDPARMLRRKAPVSRGTSNGRPGLSPEDRQNGNGEGADGPFGRVAAGAFEATLRGGITDANGTLAELLGYPSPQDLVGSSLAELIADPAVLDRVLGHAREGKELAGEEVPLRTKRGDEVVVLLCTKLVGSGGEGGRRVAGALIDITERKHRESDLERLAFEDPLTGVANRRALDDHAAKYLALAERRGTLVGLVYLDLTGFKVINDRYGHAAGDAVLVESARRLEAGARESDVVSRVGGDEFVVLLPDVDDRDAVVTAARRIRGGLEEAPIELEDGEAAVAVRAEAGIAVYPEHGSSLEELVRAADRAMYRAKERNGRARPRGKEARGVAARRSGAAAGDRPPSRRAQH